MTVVEKIDGVVIRTINNAVRNQTYQINVDVSTLSPGSHSLTITASDDKGGLSTRTITFRISTIKYTITLNKPIDIGVNQLFVNKKLTLLNNNVEAVLSKADGDILTFESQVQNSGIVDLSITAKAARNIKNIVYTVY